MEMTTTLAVPESLEMPLALIHRSDLLFLIPVVIAAYVLFFVYQRHRMLAKQQLQNPLADFVNSLESRLLRVDQNLQNLARRLDQLQLGQGGKNDFRRAEHLMQGGASTSQLVDQCGLTRGEAELFHRLHS